MPLSGKSGQVAHAPKPHSEGQSAAIMRQSRDRTMSRTTDSPSTAAERALPLRERKKARTRRALVDVALTRFSERGFEATTLDELVDAVEVSKRTFFRNFTSKEDVALTVEKELWSAYLAEMEHRELRGDLLTALRQTLVEMVRQRSKDWSRRFLMVLRIIDETPIFHAHCLRFCAEVRETLVELLAKRLGTYRADDVRLRLVVDLMILAWRCATHEWITAKGTGGVDGLAARIERVFNAIPASMALTAD